MFTGIVEELGVVVGREDHRVRIGAHVVLEDVHLGDSIAVNGCCLTVVDYGDSADRSDIAHDRWWQADLSDETLARTNLGDLRPGDVVNLERPVRLQDRLGGHLVQGHVDTIGEIIDPAPDLCVRIDPALMRYVVEKGSITVDGISLTVVEAGDDRFTAAIIPHTTEVTTLGTKGPGQTVNLELDVMAKYAEKLLAWRMQGAGA